jgi:hypothetical protein
MSASILIVEDEQIIAADLRNKLISMGPGSYRDGDRPRRLGRYRNGQALQWFT